EGHLSSIVFRTAEMNAKGEITIKTPTRFVTSVSPYTCSKYDRLLFARKLAELGLLDDFAENTLHELGDTFTFPDLKTCIDRRLRRGAASASLWQPTAKGMIALAQANYELRFDADSRLSERVIFPNTPAEMRGIEDARWVAFREAAGGITYYATYSAYDGEIVLPQIVATKDFLNFQINTLNGPEVRNKGMALFPRKIGGCYAMISRQDGENVYIMFSEMLHFWYEKRVLLRPT